MGGKVADHVSARSLDIAPVSTNRSVRVNLEPGAPIADRDGRASLSDFEEGENVAIVLPPGGGSVAVEQVGKDGPVTGRGVAALVLGAQAETRRRR